MKWDSHIKYTIKKLQTILPRFKHIKKYLRFKEMEQIYYSLIESHLRYGITAWGATLRVHLKPLEILQKRFLKILATPQTNCIKKVEKWTLDNYYFYTNVKYHFAKDKANCREHPYNTRNNQNLIFPIILKKSISQRSYAYTAVKLYNTIPDEIKKLNNRSLFRKHLKSFIFENHRTFFVNLIEE